MITTCAVRKLSDLTASYERLCHAGCRHVCPQTGLGLPERPAIGAVHQASAPYWACRRMLVADRPRATPIPDRHVGDGKEIICHTVVFGQPPVQHTVNSRCRRPATLFCVGKVIRRIHGAGVFQNFRIELVTGADVDEVRFPGRPVSSDAMEIFRPSDVGQM